MRILLIDTCGAEGSVAIADGDGAGGEYGQIVSAMLPGRSASEKLVGVVREMAEQCEISLHDLDAIAVVNGPGSFTGARVGLSAAKGLCEALDIPLIAISRLAVLASRVDTKPGNSVFAVLDAGRSEFYLGEYRDGVKVYEILATREGLRSLVDTSASEGMFVVCELAIAQALEEFSPMLIPEPDAAIVLPLVMLRIERGEFDDVTSIDANYLRRTDLEIIAKVKSPKGSG